MYPTGIGSSFQDVRRSNFTKSQSLQYANGHVGMKDISETTANVAPHPTDMLGTNLRRGKGLTFSKGIANFDGFVQGQAVDSRPGSAMGQRPSSSAGRTQQDIVASLRGPGLTDAPGGAAHSARSRGVRRLAARSSPFSRRATMALARRRGVPRPRTAAAGCFGRSLRR